MEKVKQEFMLEVQETIMIFERLSYNKGYSNKTLPFLYQAP